MKQVMGFWVSLLTVLLMVSCGGSRQRVVSNGYGGGWADAQLNLKPEMVSGSTEPGPDDSTAKTGNQGTVKSNIGHIKKDIKHMTSKEKIEGIRSEIPLFNRNNMYYPDSSNHAVQTEYRYFSNKNVIIGTGMGAIGLVALGVFPIFGFLILMLGLLIGIVGFYDVRHPGELD
jgi:hypothetical protein